MMLKVGNIALALVNVILLALLLITAFRQIGSADDDGLDSEALRLYEQSAFELSEKPTDINPGRDFVLYTNYACPYCASFYELTDSDSYTTRLLILEKDSQRFATQREVSGYMLKLYRQDADVFNRVESYLFSTQDEWTQLDGNAVIAVLNQESGEAWSVDDLKAEIEELEKAREDTPADLQYIPALFSDGKQYSQLVLNLVG